MLRVLTEKLGKKKKSTDLSEPKRGYVETLTLLGVVSAKVLYKSV